MDTTSFSHGQTQSKLWLCEKLEPLLPDNAVVAVLGCWYNVLGFMLLTRCKSKYQHILGIDISPEAIAGADKICQGFMIGDDARLRNDCADAGTVNLQGQQVVINCSAEHMTDDWFGNVDPSTLVCIQTSNVNEPEAPWLVTNPVTTLDDFAKRFPMSRTMLLEKIHFDYGSFSYDRYMLIGRK